MGMYWRSMRIQWTSIESPGVRVSAALVSARVSVAVARLLFLLIARMRLRNSEGWSVRVPEMLVTLSGPWPVWTVRPCVSLYDVVHPFTILYTAVDCDDKKARRCAASCVPRLNSVEVVARIVWLRS